MIDRLGVHAAHQAHLIGDAADGGEQFAQFDAGGAAAAEGADGGHRGPLRIAAGHRGETRGAPDALRNIFACPGAHHRLGVEQIDMRRPSPLPKHDDPFGSGRMVGQAGQPGHAPRRSCQFSCRCIAGQQRGQRHTADPHACRTEQAAAGDSLLVVVPQFVHGAITPA